MVYLIPMITYRHVLFTPFILLWCIFLISGCGGINSDVDVVATSTPIPTAPAVARTRYLVQQGDVINYLEFTGRWLPRDQRQLSFEQNGTIRQVVVQRGDFVSAGDLLADFDITNLENQLTSKLLQLESAQQGVISGAEGEADTILDLEVALANARLNLESTRNNSSWTQVANAQMAIESAKRTLENAKRNLDNVSSRPVTLSDPSQGTMDDNALGRQSSGNVGGAVDSAWEQVQSAQRSIVQAQNSYYSAAQTFRNWEIQVIQSENGVLVAEHNLQVAKESGGLTDAQQLKTLRSAELDVSQTRAEIAASSLYTPADGVILEVNIQPGDAVSAFNAVITIGNPEPKEIIANIVYGDVQSLSVGQIGICEIANQLDTAVQCIIRYLPLSPRESDQTTRVAATLPESLEGQVITVRMSLDSAFDVLWLPPEAVRQFNDRTFVILETPEGPQQKLVQLGLQTDDRVEIRGGLEAGDVVLGD